MKQLFRYVAAGNVQLSPHAHRVSRPARAVLLTETPADLAAAGIYEVEMTADGQERRRSYTQRWVVDSFVHEAVKRPDGSVLARSSYGFEAASEAAAQLA